MTVNIDVRVNTLLRIPFTDPQLLEGKASFSFMLLKDGIIYTGLTTPIVYEEQGSGLYCVGIEFNSTGYYTVFVEGVIRAYVHVVAKDVYSILTDLDDVAQGSWRYDKVTKIITIYRQNGSVLRTYDMTDNNQETSRELIL